MNFVIWYKKLVVITASFFLLATLAVFFYSYYQKPPIQYSIKPTLTFGNLNSKIEILIFEDLMCEECKDFFLHIFPLIKTNYLDTNLIKLSWIPVEIVGNSQKSLTEIYCAYLNSPNSALELINNHFLENSNTSQNSYNCDSKYDLQEVTKENLKFAEKMLGDEFEVPAIVLNGKKLNDVNYFLFKKEVDKLLNYKNAGSS